MNLNKIFFAAGQPQAVAPPSPPVVPEAEEEKKDDDEPCETRVVPEKA